MRRGVEARADTDYVIVIANSTRSFRSSTSSV
jgi:hypothetical protein